MQHEAGTPGNALGRRGHGGNEDLSGAVFELEVEMAQTARFA
jgi:hypothetical protein